jgi:hypothetical protein
MERRAKLNHPLESHVRLVEGDSEQTVATTCFRQPESKRFAQIPCPKILASKRENIEQKASVVRC